MKYRKIFSQFLLAGLLVGVMTSCKKKDNDSASVDFVTDRDGNKYSFIRIGDQLWTVENLKTTRYNDGSPIPLVTGDAEWDKLQTGAFCNYNNADSNVNIYGRLYNGYAVSTGKLAPKGWRVPTDEDWEVLEYYLYKNWMAYEGSHDKNHYAKTLSAKKGWKYSQEVGTPGNDPEKNNKTGFSGLPAGSRESSFDGAGQFGKWWCYNPKGGNYAISRSLSFDRKYLSSGNGPQKNGFSVRLVKDY